MPFDLYINVRDGLSYAPKLFAPEWINESGIDWKYQQQGGLASISVELAVPFEQLPVNAGDYIEVIAQGELDSLGRALPRARGIVTIPEQSLDTKETYKLTASGMMADMDKVLIEQVFIDPVGSNQDLSWYATQLASHYQQRKAQMLAGGGVLPPLALDIQNVGINLEQLVCDACTARAAMDQIYAQGAGSITWGWDIDPLAGANRLYLRGRTQTVARQFFVGGSVQLLSVPAELDQMVNAVKIKGGAAKHPNLLTNASVEQPQNPGADSGDLVVNGGFETPYVDSSDPGRGGNSNISPWVGAGGVTRNGYSPSTNHNASPHTGAWYLLLDNTGKSVYQDVDVSGDPVGTAYIGYLYARQENALHLASGVFSATEVDNTGAATGTSASQTVSPASIAYSGGAVSAVVGSDSLQIGLTKTSASTTKIRIKQTCTTTSGAGFGLIVDDIVFAKVGAVGQYGWGTHVRVVGSASNVFHWIDWACPAAAWDGAFGIRCNVTAAIGNECYINPAGPDLDPTSDFHFKPGAQQSLNVGCYVRMKVSGGAGQARIEYREWAADGHETQHQYTADTTIPDDGLWHLLSETISAHGDAATATVQLAFSGSGTYDVDGFFARDASVALPTTSANMQSPTLANYLRGANFEKYVRAQDVCPATGGTAADTTANSSSATWGTKEAVYSNQNLIDWTADAAAILQAYFRRAANLLHRPRVVLIDEIAQIPLPGDTGLIQVSGTVSDPPAQWCSAADYSWKSRTLTTTLDMSDERPTLAKLLLGVAGAAATASGGGSASSSVGAPAGGGKTDGGGVKTPAPGLRLAQFPASTSGVNGSYTLPQTPDGNIELLFSDLGLDTSGSFSVAGNVLTTSFATPAEVSNIVFVFSY